MQHFSLRAEYMATEKLKITRCHTPEQDTTIPNQNLCVISDPHQHINYLKTLYQNCSIPGLSGGSNMCDAYEFRFTDIYRASDHSARSVFAQYAK